MAQRTHARTHAHTNLKEQPEILVLFVQPQTALENFVCDFDGDLGKLVPLCRCHPMADRDVAGGVVRSVARCGRG